MTLDELKRLIAEASEWPWHVEEARGIEGELCFFDILADGKYRGGVATVGQAEHIGGITWPEAEANARLIAAAPDLAAQVVKLTEALADTILFAEGLIHSEYDGTSQLAELLAELNDARAILEALK